MTNEFTRGQNDRFTIRQNDRGIIIVTLVASLLIPESPPLDEALENLLDRPRRILLDLTAITYLGVVGVGMLINLQKKVTKAGGKLRLCGLSPNALEVVKLATLDRLFDIRGTESDALVGF